MDSKEWNSQKGSDKLKTLLRSAGLSLALAQVSYNSLNKTERAKIEKAAKGSQGWHEEKVPVVTEKGVEKKAPIHRQVAIEAALKDTERTPMVAPEPKKVYRYASFNRPLWNGFDTGTPYKIVDIQKSDYLNDRKPHDVIETQAPISPEHIKNLELTDYAEVEEKNKLYAYAKTVFSAGSHLNQINDLIKNKKITTTEKIDEYKAKLDKQNRKAETDKQGSELQQIYLKGKEHAVEKLGTDINDYTKVLYGVEAVLKHKGLNYSVDYLSSNWHMPLAMFHNESIEQIIKSMEGTQQQNKTESHETTHAISVQNVSWRMNRLSSAVSHDPKTDEEEIISVSIKNKYPDIRKNTKAWAEQVVKIGDKALNLAIENRKKNIETELAELKKYYEKDAKPALVKARKEAQYYQDRAEIIKALVPDSPTIKQTMDEVNAINRRADEYEDYIKKEIQKGKDALKESVSSKDEVLERLLKTEGFDYYYKRPDGRKDKVSLNADDNDLFSVKLAFNRWNEANDAIVYKIEPHLTVEEEQAGYKNDPKFNWMKEIEYPIEFPTYTVTFEDQDVPNQRSYWNGAAWLRVGFVQDGHGVTIPVENARDWIKDAQIHPAFGRGLHRVPKHLKESEKPSTPKISKEEESEMSTDWNYAHKKALKLLEDKRNEYYKTPEGFRAARKAHLENISSDFHLKSHKDKAEEYKVGTIQYNKHMAKYNERLEEIAELKREIEAGKTIEELQLEEVMRQNDLDFTEDRKEKDRRAQVKATDTDTLKNRAFTLNKTYSNESLPMKERMAAKSDIREIISILHERGIDTVPFINELNAQMKAG